MLIIGENINGSAPWIRNAITNRDESFILSLAKAQQDNGCHYIDICASSTYENEYDELMWMIDLLKSESGTSMCVDSPYEDVLVKIMDSGVLPEGAFINSVSLERDKCEKLFRAAEGSDFSFICMCCDDDGINKDTAGRMDVMKGILSCADSIGINHNRLYADFCMEAVCLKKDSFSEYIRCMRLLREFAPDVNTFAALSNVSYGMPSRNNVNRSALGILLCENIDCVMLDGTDKGLLGEICAFRVLSGDDPYGRNYNKYCREGRF